MRSPTLVLGIGNILLRDDGVGVRVIEAMALTEASDSVEFYEGATAGLDLLEVIAGRAKVIIIDAIASDGEPGTVLRLGPDDLLSPQSPGASVHDIGLAETLALAKHFQITPDELVIFGITPADLDYGLELSPQVAAVVPRVIELVRAELCPGQRPQTCEDQVPRYTDTRSR